MLRILSLIFTLFFVLSMGQIYGQHLTRTRIFKTGLTTVIDRSVVPHGVVMFTPVYPENKMQNTVKLIDTWTGKVVHSWSMGDKRPGLWGYMPSYDEIKMYKGAKKGAILYISQLPMSEVKHSHDFVAWAQDRGGVMELVNFDGSIVWRYVDEDQHHDARVTKNGLLTYIAAKPMTIDTKESLVKKLALTRREFPMAVGQKKMYSDIIYIVNPLTHEVVFEWKTEDYLDPNIDKLNFNDPLDEWTHGNTIVPIYENQNNPTVPTHLLVSFRQISTVIKIDLATRSFERLARYPHISQQHDCSLIKNVKGEERLLLFNNRFVPNDSVPLPASQVLQFDLTQKGPHPMAPYFSGPKVDWLYQDGVEFYSAYISGAQRISEDEHGFYTLVTEGLRGRMFIVKSVPFMASPTGYLDRIVFEYLNPETSQDVNPFDNVLGRGAVFRARFHPYSKDYFSKDQVNKMLNTL